MNKTVIKKEFREEMYENYGLWLIAGSALVLSVLCLLVCLLKEGNVLAQNDVLQYAIKAVMFLTLTVAMVLGAASFSGEREENTLESLLLTPISKRSLVSAKYMGVLAVGTALYLISIPYILGIGWGSGLTGTALLIDLICGFLLLLGFAALAVIFSITIKTSKASILISVLLMVILTGPTFIQGLLKKSFLGRAFLSIDPVANCFNAMNDILTNRLPVSSEMKYLLPLIVFSLVCIVLMVCLSSKLSLRGEK